MALPGKKLSMRDRIKQRAEERNKASGGFGYLSYPEGTEFFTLKKGMNSLDILPYRVTVSDHPEGVPVGDTWFRRSFEIHPKVGTEGKYIVCPKSVKKPCPICEEAQRLRKTGEATDDEVKALRPKKKELFNVKDRNEDGGKPRLMEVSYYNFSKQLDEEVREGNEDNALFAELQGGKTLNIRTAEKTFNKNTFFEVTRVDFANREDLNESILDQTVDLDKAIKVLSYKEIQDLFFGVTEEGVAEEEVTEQEAAAPAARSASAKPAPVRERTRPQEEVAEDPEPISKPTARPGTPPKPAVQQEENVCIAPKGTFGEADKYSECAKCDIWESCVTEQEKTAKKK